MRELFEQLEAIESASGSNAKKAILTTLCKNKHHKKILENCLSPLFPMYLGKEAKFFPFDPETEEHSAKAFPVLMESLNDGLIDRGGKAIEAVSGAIGSFCNDNIILPTPMPSHINYRVFAMKWIPRLVTKDLQIGVSWETFTKVNGEKKFAVMLAKDINKIKNIEKKFTLPVYVQPKLDGYRGIANTSGDFELRSRNGKEYKNFPHLVEALREVCPDYILPDCEVMSDDFQAMQKTAFRQDNKEVGDVKLHIFDAITREEWDNREGQFTFEERMDSIENLIGHHDLIKIVETYVCNSWEEVYEHHARFIEEGHEGTMVRANEPYQFKRTDFLAKIKDMLSMDCEVLSVEEGRNSLVGSMGHLVVRQENGVECGVGSGFTLEDRKLIYDCEDLTIGRIAEIKYQELTAGDKVMRFPVFVRWRDDL